MSVSHEIELTQTEIEDKTVYFNNFSASTFEEAIEIFTGRLMSLKRQLPPDFKVEILRFQCPIYLF